MPLHTGWTPIAQGAQGSSNPQAAQGAAGGQNEVPQGLATMIAKNNNDALKVAEILHGDNYQLREKNRQLQAQMDGAVILRDGDKTTWDAYQALGAPGEIATKLRQSDIEKVAGKAQYNPTVLARLDEMAGGRLQYETKLETVDGVQMERVFVRDGDIEQPLHEYAAATWAEFLPSLQPVANGQGLGSNGAATPPPAPGLRFPSQHPGGGGQPVTTKTVAENTLNRAYKPREDKK